MQISFKCEDPSLFPLKGTEEAAGFDLKAAEDYSFAPGQSILVSTGVRVKIPKGYVGLLIARSSLHKRGFKLENSVGVIDSDYRGCIFAPIYLKDTFKECIMSKNERIVQLVVIPYAVSSAIEFNGPEEEWITDRGEGRFGSTGTI